MIIAIVVIVTVKVITLVMIVAINSNGACLLLSTHCSTQKDGRCVEDLTLNSHHLVDELEDALQNGGIRWTPHWV